MFKNNYSFSIFYLQSVLSCSNLTNTINTFKRYINSQKGEIINEENFKNHNAFYINLSFNLHSEFD